MSMVKQQIELFRKILNKYRFTDPIPSEVLDSIVKIEKRLLKATFKQTGNLSVYYSVVLDIYFGFMKFGVKLSVAQSKIVFAGVAGVISVIISASLIFAFSGDTWLSLRKKTKDIGKTEKKEVTVIDNFKETKYRIGVSPFLTKSVEKGKALEITNRIFNETELIAGKNKVVFLDNDKKKPPVNMMLMGSIGRLGKRYVITARIVDVEKSNILWTTTKNIDSENKLIDVCKELAGEVAMYMK